MYSSMRGILEGTLPIHTWIMHVWWILKTYCLGFLLLLTWFIFYDHCDFLLASVVATLNFFSSLHVFYLPMNFFLSLRDVHVHPPQLNSCSQVHFCKYFSFGCVLVWKTCDNKIQHWINESYGCWKYSTTHARQLIWGFTFSMWNCYKWF